ncbi:serine protease family S33 [Achlya hypogyna]|uniref:Serine protease family S33 n=1 Tax=Achlya hypogyna TaxID=1202772 RepID=A0A1V9YPH6_ACHHY|nr:serine protease family S33 [Achlya hypogyna]
MTVTDVIPLDRLFTKEALALHYDRVERATLANGLCVHYALHGPDDAPQKVLLIMGLLGDKEAWLPLLSAFRASPTASKYQLVTFDNRGVGGSDKPWGRYSTSQMATDAKLLLDHLGWCRAHVVGASMGGMIAQELAHAYPRHVQSLALLVTSPSFALGPWPSWHQLAAYWAIGRSILFPSPQTGAGTMLYVLFPDEYLRTEHAPDLTVGAILHRHHLERQEQTAPTLSGVLGQYAAVMLHRMSYWRLRQVAEAGYPILIVGAKKDRMLHPDHSKQLYEALRGPKTTLAMYEGSGHDVHVQHRDEVAAALVAHFQIAE